MLEYKTKAYVNNQINKSKNVKSFHSTIPYNTKKQRRKYPWCFMEGFFSHQSCNLASIKKDQASKDISLARSGPVHPFSAVN
jgi:hypothetical protein